MNKSELIDTIAEKVGGRAAAAKAVDAVLDSIMAAVAKGERVGIVGFGTFEKRVRGARTARNIRTGATIKVKATSVPAFRAGSGFKETVASGGKKTGAKKAAPAKAAKAAAKPAAKKTAAKAAPAKKAATKAPAKTATKAAAKKAPAKKAAKGR
ncbi:MAG TPA: HU family DNA-binding protein [Frankiaceae bacterium]|nr:HU family DNA-binding protein [Frankiaceae bacterium]